MADVEFQLTGLDQLLRKMKAVAPAVKKKGARFAGRKAANVIRDAVVTKAARLNDPATSEEIAKNVAVRFSSKQFKRTGDVVFRVGILGGARQYSNTKVNVRKRRVGQTYATGGSSSNPGGDTFYWRQLEFGTKNMQARPFMRPALAENVDRATNEFTRQMNLWLDRYFSKSGINATDL